MGEETQRKGFRGPNINHTIKPGMAIFPNIHRGKCIASFRSFIFFRFFETLSQVKLNYHYLKKYIYHYSQVSIIGDRATEKRSAKA